jgi:hypothetical protein
MYITIRIIVSQPINFRDAAGVFTAHARPIEHRLALRPRKFRKVTFIGKLP